MGNRYSSIIEKVFEEEEDADGILRVPTRHSALEIKRRMRNVERKLRNKQANQDKRELTKAEQNRITKWPIYGKKE